MKSWPAQDAAARFNAILDACEREGPQLVTRQGTEAAVLIPIAEWRRLAAARPTLKDLLLTDEDRFEDFEIPPREKRRHSAPPAF
jgi:prevent-host-death family protein